MENAIKLLCFLNYALLSCNSEFNESTMKNRLVTKIAYCNRYHMQDLCRLI